MNDELVKEICIEVYGREGTPYIPKLLLNDEDDRLVYKSCDTGLKLSVIVNKELTEAHIIEKDIIIADEDCDIELRVLEAAFDAKMTRLESTESGFEDVDEKEHECIDMDPYDPKLIRVDSKNFSVQMVVDMINEKEIDLAPAFQRRFVWNDITRKSRLIESLLLRIPIPVFYFAQDEEGLFQVVDGVQRLTVLRSFMNNEFKLKNLEYLHDCEGKWYKKKNNPGESLDSLYTRRIEQTQLYINVIDPQTPNRVKYDIFRRINTGGKELNNQEIRNCLANNKTRDLLRELASSKNFKKATRGSIKSTRMADEELVLRFVAFYLVDNGKSSINEYKGGMDAFLDLTVNVLNEMKPDLFSDIRVAFINAMDNSYYLFGDNSFRKANYINKSLFLGLSRTLCRYTKEDMQKKPVDAIRLRINKALTNEGELWHPLSIGTNDARNINFVYEFLNNVMETD